MAGLIKGEASGFIVETTLLVELRGLFWWTAAAWSQMLGCVFGYEFGIEVMSEIFFQCDP